MYEENKQKSFFSVFISDKLITDQLSLIIITFSMKNFAFSKLIEKILFSRKFLAIRSFPVSLSINQKNFFLLAFVTHQLSRLPAIRDATF